MSLKDFHIVFITASVVLAFGFSVWGMNQYHSFQEPVFLWGGCLSFLGALCLLTYEIFFIKKTRS